MTNERPRFYHTEKNGIRSFILSKYKDGTIEVCILLSNFLFTIPKDAYKYKTKAFIVKDIKQKIDQWNWEKTDVD